MSLLEAYLASVVFGRVPLVVDTDVMESLGGESDSPTMQLLESSVRKVLGRPTVSASCRSQQP